VGTEVKFVNYRVLNSRAAPYSGSPHDKFIICRRKLHQVRNILNNTTSFQMEVASCNNTTNYTTPVQSHLFSETSLAPYQSSCREYMPLRPNNNFHSPWASKLTASWIPLKSIRGHLFKVTGLRSLVNLPCVRNKR
jgi:hypothetical protein